MKVVCCLKENDPLLYYFTIGKIYETTPIPNVKKRFGRNDIRLIDDLDQVHYVNVTLTHFLTLEEYRNNQLGKIGI